MWLGGTKSHFLALVRFVCMASQSTSVTVLKLPGAFTQTPHGTRTQRFQCIIFSKLVGVLRSSTLLHLSSCFEMTGVPTLWAECICTACHAVKTHILRMTMMTMATMMAMTIIPTTTPMTMAVVLSKRKAQHTTAPVYVHLSYFIATTTKWRNHSPMNNDWVRPIWNRSKTVWTDNFTFFRQLWLAKIEHIWMNSTVLTANDDE